MSEREGASRPALKRSQDSSSSVAGVSEPVVIACLRNAADTGGGPYPSWPRTCAASVPAERGGPARVPPPSTTSVWPVM